MPDEPQASNVIVSVNPSVAGGAARLGQQSDLLVVSDRGNLAACLLREMADREFCRGQGIFPLVSLVAIDSKGRGSRNARLGEGDWETAPMEGCGCSGNFKFDGLSAGYKRALWAVVLINGAMFLTEMGAGILAGSQALKADALDFLGDTATYAITLAVIGMPLVWRARAALFKGLTLGALGLWVLASTGYQVLVLGVPKAEMMGAIGFIALAANLTSILLLLRYRDGDANVRSVWLCSRNDAIGNVAVICAAGGVWVSGTAWPDLLVAGIMASLFLWSSVQIVRQAVGELADASAYQETAVERNLRRST